MSQLQMQVAWCAIYQDGGVSTTPSGFFDVATGERAFGVPPDLSMDEGPAVEEIAQIFSVHGCNSGLQPCSLAHFAVELNLFRCRVASVSQLNYVTVITYYILEFESIFFVVKVKSTLKHQSKKSTANHSQ